MSKRGFAPAVFFILLATACSGGDNPGGPSGGGGGGGNSSSASVSIPVTDYGGNQVPQFSPVQVTIQVGGRVSWSNSDTVAHTTTSDNNLWNAPLAPGGSFSQTFNTAGTYSYSCSVHNGMNGRVVVQ